MWSVLGDYGLFLAETITIVVAIIVVVGVIASTAASQKKQSDKAQLSIKPINDKLNRYRETLQEAVLDAKAFKQLKKQQKKHDKVATIKAKPRVFLINFNGDIKATATDHLRDSISAVLTIATSSDEVVVTIESGGGLVHSYGLASSQLQRVKDKGIPLTVCVDKVAASGGYMMACVADTICAAPFAVLGSIGVVAQVPNFHRLLKKNNVDVDVLTAGEHKRTLTLFGENTEKGREKFIDDLENTHELFKRYVKRHRPSVNIDEVATGEIWFGQDAIAQNLVDKIITSDTYIIDKAEQADIFEVSMFERKTFKDKVGLSAQSFSNSLVDGLMNQLKNFRFFN